ncbi:hypothetical protein Plhal304r1_c031g0101121 [Plasmopara halstedii]
MIEFGIVSRTNVGALLCRFMRRLRQSCTAQCRQLLMSGMLEFWQYGSQSFK